MIYWRWKKNLRGYWVISVCVWGGVHSPLNPWSPPSHTGISAATGVGRHNVPKCLPHFLSNHPIHQRVQWSGSVEGWSSSCPLVRRQREAPSHPCTLSLTQAQRSCDFGLNPTMNIVFLISTPTVGVHCGKLWMSRYIPWNENITFSKGVKTCLFKNAHRWNAS